MFSRAFRDAFAFDFNAFAFAFASFPRHVVKGATKPPCYPPRGVPGGGGGGFPKNVSGAQIACKGLDVPLNALKVPKIRAESAQDLQRPTQVTNTSVSRRPKIPPGEPRRPKSLQNGAKLASKSHPKSILTSKSGFLEKTRFCLKGKTAI